MTNKMKYLLVACLMMIASTCMAQHEELAKMQATRISQSLGLDDKTSQKFITTFCQCRKEMGATRPRHQHKKRVEMTDAEVDKAIKADFAQGRKLLDIREKYYKAYSKFLTPKQIQRVYDMERQDMQRFAKRWEKKGGPKKDGPGKGKPGCGKPGKPSSVNGNK